MDYALVVSSGEVSHLNQPIVHYPSYVLGGRAMEIVHQEAELKRYMNEAVGV